MELVLPALPTRFPRAENEVECRSHRKAWIPTRGKEHGDVIITKKLPRVKRIL